MPGAIGTRLLAPATDCVVLVVSAIESEVTIEVHCVGVHVLSLFQQRAHSACSEVLLAALLADVRIFVTSLARQLNYRTSILHAVQ